LHTAFLTSLVASFLEIFKELFGDKMKRRKVGI